MECAAELGYTIKLLGIATQTKHGIEQRVHPCMVAMDSPLGTVQHQGHFRQSLAWR
jgi:homoserine dehydrogenase